MASNAGGGTPRDPLPPINFEALARELLATASTLVPQWLPGGKMRNQEYFVQSVWRDEKTPSLSVRMSGSNAGQWRDHGGDAVGGDLISLYAAIHGMGMGQAALQLARELGLEDVAGVQRARAGDAASPPPPPRPPPPPASKPPPSDEGWRTSLPVPPHAPAPTFKHHYRTPADLTHTATYSMDGHVLGYVVRFKTSDGGKETLPYTWCTSAKDGASCWKWRQWDEPRPLYLPAGLSVKGWTDKWGAAPTVVVVEGEKKADILQALLDAGAPGVYLVASWPGGSKAWGKALWDWLAGCTVLLWPDCDGKRVVLSKKERDDTPDPLARAVLQQAKPLLPAHKQVGMVAMLGIGQHLRAEHTCMVQILPIPQPGTVLDGWDCADAITTDGWDFARVLAFFATAHALPPPDGEKAPPGSPGADAGPSEGAASGGNGGKGGGGGKKNDGPGDPGDGDDAFADHLMFICSQQDCEVHDIGVNRKLLITALRKAPALQNCLGFNELTGAPSTREPWPWRSDVGPLKDADALRLGDWLSTTYKIKAASRAALDEAIDTVADARRFHPIRDWLAAQEHDGRQRMDKWLIYVLGMDPDKMPVKRRKYLEMMGRFLLLGLVARVMEPGCKFDYSPVFEGLTGMGKSTLVKELVGKEFFSDTHFDIGNGKEGMEQLEGLWVYELSEMTAFRRADNEQVKQFFSSTVDRFRGAYGKFVQPHPRQCVIMCTTNKRVYLYDLTGNRRFWPVWIDQPVRIEWIKKWRTQLFAEAYALYKAGERYAPTREEEDEFFVPEQAKRLVETAVQSRLYELLTRDGAPPTEGKTTVDLNVNTTFVTLDRLVGALGADAAKSSSILEGQIRGWLEAQGWTYGRESTGQRRRGYKQPKAWPPKIDDDDDASPQASDSETRLTQAVDYEGSDDEPF